MFLNVYNFGNMFLNVYNFGNIKEHFLNVYTFFRVRFVNIKGTLLYYHYTLGSNN